MSQNAFPFASSQASTSAAPQYATPASYHPLPRPKPLPLPARRDTQAIKQELHDALGENGLPYWKAMNGYLVGQLGRSELEEMVRGWLKGSKIHLHNRMLVSLLHNASTSSSQAIPSATVARKRKRVSVDDPEFDIDDTTIESKSRIAQWVSHLTNRDRGRIRRFIAGKPVDPSTETDESHEEWEEKRKKLSPYAPNNLVPPPATLTERMLPSSNQMSQRLSVVAKDYGLQIRPDLGEDIGQFLAVGLDHHLCDILHDLVRLTARERPGEDTIRIPRGQGHSLPNGAVNHHQESISSVVPKPDISTIHHLLNMHPALQSGPSPATYKLVSSQTLGEAEAYQPSRDPDPPSTPMVNGDGTTSSKPTGNAMHLGGPARPDAVARTLLESGLLKIDKAERPGEEGEGKKTKRHNLHWKYEDPALILRDVLG